MRDYHSNLEITTLQDHFKMIIWICGFVYLTIICILKIDKYLLAKEEKRYLLLRSKNKQTPRDMSGDLRDFLEGRWK